MIIKAQEKDFETVKHITVSTIQSVYPHYYPEGAVKFFIAHHNDENILNDIRNNRCYLLVDDNSSVAGTVTIKKNNICRLFVLPQFQKQGYGRILLDFCEKKISESYDTIVIDSSLPAKAIYLKRGYKETKYNVISTENNDFLCYDEMIKYIK